MNSVILKILNFEQFNLLAGVIGLFLFFSFFVYNFHYGERLQAGNGLGYDGIKYAIMAQTDPVKNFTEKIYGAYNVRRLFPSTMIHYGSQIFRHSLNTPEKIVKAFYIYNFILILIGVFVWFLIAKFYKWSAPLYLISFSALFINYAILKNSIYYPILTDISGMIAGLVTFYFYLKDKWFLLFIASIISSFIWPSMNYLMVPLLAFKVQNMQLPTFKCNKFSNIVSLMSVVSLMTLFIFKKPSFAFASNKLILFNIILLGLFLFLALRPFIDLGYIFSQFRHSVSSYRATLSRIALSILFFLIVKLSISFIADDNSPADPFDGIIGYIFHVLSSGTRLPLMHIASHVLYYGPLVLLIIFLWNDFVRVTKETGLGMVIFVAIYVILNVVPESRQIIPALPVFSILICRVLNEQKVGWPFASAFFILSLVTSRFWLPQNIGNWGTLTKLGYTDFHSFPEQLYFMNHGLWQSPMMYTVFLGITIILAVCMYALLELHQQKIIAKDLN